MGDKLDKVRVEYTHGDQCLRFRASGPFGKIDSFPVECKVEEEEITGKPVKAGSKGLESDFSLNADINYLISLFDGVKGHKIALRVMTTSKGSKQYGMFRTIDKFLLTNDGKIPIEETEETQECQVIRFMPSRD